MPSARTISSTFCVAVLCGALTWASSVQANPARRTYLWGFQNGCQSMPEADRALEKQLHAQQTEVWLLRTQEGTSAPPVCSPNASPQCGQSFRAMCPQAQGQLLGGSIVRGKDVLKLRLWLYDFDTGSVAVQDDYCQSCDVLTALGTQAHRLLTQPRFGSLPGPMPLYCLSGNVGSPIASPRKTPVHLLVYGDGKHKAAVFSTLKTQLASTGRPVLPVTVEAKSYTLDVMQRILAGNSDAQIVGVELHREGKVGVWVFDGKTEQTADRVLDCTDCEKSKDVLLARIQPELETLLSRCFGQGCGDASPAALPKEACEPFPEPSCSGLDALLRFLPEPSARPAFTPSRLDARTSTALNALLWSGVAASAATSLGLFVANATEAGIRGQPAAPQVGDTLWYPAWTAAGITLGLTGLAIPATLMIRRVTAKPDVQRSAQTQRPQGPLPIRCPD